MTGRWPTDQWKNWYPKSISSCDHVYNVDISMPANSNARLMYFDSVKLKELVNPDGSYV